LPSVQAFRENPLQPARPAAATITPSWKSILYLFFAS